MPTTPPLTQSLTAPQLKANIDALKKGGLGNTDIQAYVNNYKSDGVGGYTLATSADATPSNPAAPAAQQPITASTAFQTVAQPSVLGDAGKELAGTTMQRAQTVVNAEQKPAADVAAGAPATTVVKDIGMSGATAVGQVAGQVGDMLAAATPAPVKNFISSVASKAINPDAVKTLADNWNTFQSAHPDVASLLGDVFNVAGLFGGSEAEAPLKSAASDAAESVASGVSKVADTVSTAAKNTVDAAKGIVTKAPTAVEKDSINTAIRAVQPELNGKAEVGAYAKDFGKNIQEKSFFKGQSLAPDKATIDLGTRLKDVLKSSDPAKNIKSLGIEFDATESKLAPLLQNDKTPIVKQSVADTLDQSKTSLPREFTRIGGENSKVVDDVFDFAKERVNDAEPTVNGLRNARIEFDQQAKTQYPNAFKNGAIDLKTAAGAAIKSARDTINDYMYQTAENGSELQRLIGHESDLFRARDIIANKAAANDGASTFSDFISHPIVKRVGKVVGLGAGAAAGTKVLSEL